MTDYERPKSERGRVGEADEIRFAVRACSLGALLVAATDKGICAVGLADGHEPLLASLHARFPTARSASANAAFEALVTRIIDLAEAPGPVLDLPLDLRGTAFQQSVWRALQAIPPGRTETYARVAARIGAPLAIRAVAGACAANPVALAIPCHRVVRSDGTPSGHAWGLHKHALLDREAIAANAG